MKLFLIDITFATSHNDYEVVFNRYQASCGLNALVRATNLSHASRNVFDVILSCIVIIIMNELFWVALKKFRMCMNGYFLKNRVITTCLIAMEATSIWVIPLSKRRSLSEVRSSYELKPRLVDSIPNFARQKPLHEK